MTERKLILDSLKICGPDKGILVGPYEIYGEFNDGFSGRIGWKDKTEFLTKEEAEIAKQELISTYNKT